MVPESSLLSSTFVWLCVLCCTCFVVAFEPVDEILIATFEVKSTEQYFAVCCCCCCFFCRAYKVVLILSLWMKLLSATIQMKAIEHCEQSFPVVLFIRAVHARLFYVFLSLWKKL